MRWAAQMWVDPPDGLDTHCLLVPDWARRLQGDRGQAWLSCALTLHGCPLTLCVGGPPRLSITLPGPASFFCPSILISLPLSLSCVSCLSTALTLSHSVIFSTYLFVSCPSFPFLLLSSLVNSWVDMPAGEAAPHIFLVLLSFCLFLLLYPFTPPSLSCALPWHWRDQFTQQQLRQSSFVPGLPSEKAFLASRE